MDRYSLFKILINNIKFYNISLLIKFIKWLSNKSFHNLFKNLFNFVIKIIGFK